MKKLIVNADDFGLHTEVNRAVIQGYQKGCLRSTSLITTGSAVDEAVELAKENPGLGIGIHLTLVAERPMLPPEQVPTLVGDDGKFLPDHVAFIKRYVSGGIDREELFAECEAQIAKAMDLGINITHLDSHQHLHVLPGISKICLKLMGKYNISKMRYPGEAFFFTGGFPVGLGRRIAKCGLTVCADIAKGKAKWYNKKMPDYFFGMVAGGHNEEKYFLNILKSLPDGVSEIMIHPGANDMELGKCYDWQYHWQDELNSVTSQEVMKYITEHDISLISYADL